MIEVMNRNADRLGLRETSCCWWRKLQLRPLVRRVEGEANRRGAQGEASHGSLKSRVAGKEVYHEWSPMNLAAHRFCPLRSLS